MPKQKEIRRKGKAANQLRNPVKLATKPNARRQMKAPRPPSKTVLASASKGEGKTGSEFANTQASIPKYYARKARAARFSLQFAEKKEQTPFGPVTTRMNKNEAIGTTGQFVQFVSTNRRTAYKKSMTGIDYSSYRTIASHIDERAARLVLIELLTSELKRTSDTPEDAKARNQRGLIRQVAYQNEDPTTLRAMAMLYTLIMFPEEQRTAGGKTMRGALQLILDGEATAKEAFVGTLVDKYEKIMAGTNSEAKKKVKKIPWPELYKEQPLVPQTGLGGMTQTRLVTRGAVPVSKGFVKVDDAASDDSEEEGSREGRIARLNALIEAHNAKEKKKPKGKPLTLLSSQLVVEDSAGKGASPKGKGKVKTRDGLRDALSSSDVRASSDAAAPHAKQAAKSSLKRPRDVEPPDVDESSLKKRRIELQPALEPQGKYHPRKKAFQKRQ